MKTGAVDFRLNPENLNRHKHSEFEKYLPGHSSPTRNAVPLPFEVDEKGRQKKTEVLDHIIKRRKQAKDKRDKYIEKVKNDN